MVFFFLRKLVTNYEDAAKGTKAGRWLCRQEKSTPLYRWSAGRPPWLWSSLPLKDKEEPALHRTPRKAFQGKETGTWSLGVCQEPNFVLNILEGFRRDPRGPAYSDTHSDSVWEVAWGGENGIKKTVGFLHYSTLRCALGPMESHEGGNRDGFGIQGQCNSCWDGCGCETRLQFQHLGEQQCQWLRWAARRKFGGWGQRCSCSSFGDAEFGGPTVQLQKRLNIWCVPGPSDPLTHVSLSFRICVSGKFLCLGLLIVGVGCT